MSHRCERCERIRARLDHAEDELLRMTRLHSNVSRMLMDAEQELKRFRENGKEALRGYGGALLDQLAGEGKP